MKDDTFDKFFEKVHGEIKIFEDIVFLENASRNFREIGDKETARMLEGSLIKYYDYLKWYSEAASVSERLGDYDKAIEYYRKAGENKTANYLHNRYYSGK